MNSRPRPSRLRLAAPVAALVVGLALPGFGGLGHALRVDCAPQTPGGDWPSIGQDLSSSRVQPAERDIKPPLAPVWTFDANRWTHTTDNEVTGYPVEAGGCVFVGSSRGSDAAGRRLPGWVFALNADTGDVVWETPVNGGVYSTVAVSAGVVYAFVSRVGSPFVVALDERTGRVLWRTTVDRQPGSDAVSSPVVYDGLVWVGVSGTAAESDAADRAAFQGSTVLIATRRLTAPAYRPVDAPYAQGRASFQPGHVVRRLYTIPTRAWSRGYAGGSQWGTIAVDPRTGYGYEGTGNPFNYDAEYRTTNAVVKIDLDPGRRTFGEIVGSYKGTVEQYFPDLSKLSACHEVENVSGVFGAGTECAHLDLDFGSTPNVFRDARGRTIVAAGQKSGVLHFIDARTMTPVAKVLVGVPSQMGGIVGSAAYSHGHLYGPHTIGGYLWSVDANTHQLGWLSPIADGVHWGPPVTLANHVLYTVDLTGFLDAYDAGTGLPLMHLPMSLGTQTGTDPTFSWGGVTVARHLVFASVGVGLTSAGEPSMPDGFVIAYAPLTVSP